MRKVISVVIIDDDNDAIDAMSEALEDYEIKIIDRGHDGKEAVELYKKLKPDVIIIDVLMPKYDGHYAIKNIKEFDPDAKILVVTADVSNSTIKKLNFKKINFLYKPYNSEDIVENLQLLTEN